ncbi:helix-turn-helix domain-containing protein [Gordonia aichiensis]
MDLELRHLRGVVAVTDAGSFTTAAAQLGISQPALSRTIQQAERILDARLFERSSRSVGPCRA